MQFRCELPALQGILSSVLVSKNESDRLLLQITGFFTQKSRLTLDLTDKDQLVVIRETDMDAEGIGNDYGAARQKRLDDLLNNPDSVEIRKAPPLVVVLTGYVMDMDSRLIDYTRWEKTESGLVNPFTGAAVVTEEDKKAFLQSLTGQ